MFLLCSTCDIDHVFNILYLSFQFLIIFHIWTEEDLQLLV